MGILKKYQRPESNQKMMGLNIFNLSDKPVRLLQIFFDELSDRRNVEMLITILFMD